ncbi:hypothetical protein JTE90_011618 [Oedothorax gibbosus]|uniref:KANL3/Tex30 alpha/beta hydrolase-like domain-containing protein n=1 Tax=Oedothorax gibbosus TaxID=931172 RepID=A0AAV6U503_9ARAC|nr:hypothetical protein JTE90_011618 [Oedothorax gibbosus]
MSMIHLSIPYGDKDKTIPAIVDCLSSDKSDLKKCHWVVLTHGAGGDLRTPQLAAISSFLAKRGFAVLRFTCKGLNVKYRVKVFGEVIIFIQEKYAPKGIFIGGRSMGARAAALLISDPEALKNTSVENKILGLICLSYPLHKPKNMSELRDEPIKNLKKPVFFLSGTRDEMCNRDIFEVVLHSTKAPFKIVWLDGCDHSAKPAKNYDDDVYCEAFEAICSWCLNIGRQC